MLDLQGFIHFSSCGVLCVSPVQVVNIVLIFVVFYRWPINVSPSHFITMQHLKIGLFQTSFLFSFWFQYSFQSLHFFFPLFYVAEYFLQFGANPYVFFSFSLFLLLFVENKLCDATMEIRGGRRGWPFERLVNRHSLCHLKSPSVSVYIHRLFFIFHPIFFFYLKKIIFKRVYNHSGRPRNPPFLSLNMSAIAFSYSPRIVCFCFFSPFFIDFCAVFKRNTICGFLFFSSFYFPLLFPSFGLCRRFSCCLFFSFPK